ncbi:MAG: sugar nucleotide-binding protein [Gemmatimonadaceae bacterium]
MPSPAQHRAADIDRLADLGVRTLRYPVLWERHASNDEAWRVTDAAMTRMKERDIEPIVGWVHHGSGPSGKAEAERLVREIRHDALIVRTSAFFGDHDDHNFLIRTLAALASGKRVRVADDVRISPTYLPELVHATLDLLIDGETGTWHLTSPDVLSWADFAETAAQLAGINCARLVRTPTAELAQIALRPRMSALQSERATLLAPLSQSLARWVAARPWERLARRGRRDGEREELGEASPEHEAFTASPPPEQ